MSYKWIFIVRVPGLYCNSQKRKTVKKRRADRKRAVWTQWQMAWPISFNKKFLCIPFVNVYKTSFSVNKLVYLLSDWMDLRNLYFHFFLLLLNHVAICVTDLSFRVSFLLCFCHSNFFSFFGGEQFNEINVFFLCVCIFGWQSGSHTKTTNHNECVRFIRMKSSF